MVTRSRLWMTQHEYPRVSEVSDKESSEGSDRMEAVALTSDCQPARLHRRRSLPGCSIRVV